MISHLLSRTQLLGRAKVNDFNLGGDLFGMFSAFVKSSPMYIGFLRGKSMGRMQRQLHLHLSVVLLGANDILGLKKSEL